MSECQEKALKRVFMKNFVWHRKVRGFTQKQLEEAGRSFATSFLKWQSEWAK